MTLAPQTAHEHVDEDPATGPRADCVADSAGGLTFDITDSGESGPAHLLLRVRDSEQEVRLPLTPSADGRLRAALPSSVELPEGRWDAYVQVADEAPRRLVPGVNDLRSLVDRAPSGSRGHVAVRIPYATKHGNLTVRSWLRAPHAEAGELDVREDELGVRARVYGTVLAPEAYVEVESRHESVPVIRTGLTSGNPDFHFTVEYTALRPGLWDLWLRPAGEPGPRVRIARLLDDIADKKPIFTYPRVTAETEFGAVTARPYYTKDNDLTVKVTVAD
ncbi:hypothetical protein FNH04_31405 [Streptomyces phyllanthi]|uniref:Transferase n=2 Tax=Streptomyces phyllanthi TaxID=1803180 RepID=A0A5N8WAU8_9ACTN|nr:hypothetical protein [Streptomyces phyllanthi]MPY44252.1 hypothetical protein [Streptomyces phyllanthi]